MMHSSHTSWATVAFILAFMLGATLNDEEYKMSSKADVQSYGENPQHAPLASETSAMNEEPHTTTPIFDFASCASCTIKLVWFDEKPETYLIFVIFFYTSKIFGE